MRDTSALTFFVNVLTVYHICYVVIIWQLAAPIEFHTPPCGRFTASVSQGECGIQMESMWWFQSGVGF